MQVMEKEARFCAHNYEPLSVVLTRASGVWTWDEQGRRYLDMMSAYSAVSHGHAHPKLVDVLCTQAQRLSIVSRAFYTDRLAAFLERLVELTGLDGVMPMNTGAEAVETAIKAARRWGYREKGIAANQAEIIVAENNFHGRTTTVVSFSSEEEYRADFGPFTPGFKIVKYADIDAIEAAITPNTCAVLIEPIQGEGGIVVPPAGFLTQLRALCDRHNVLMLLDEIQSGLGRTGRMFAYQHDGILPDGVMLGKALGGGLLPVSAFVATRAVIGQFNPGSHGSTFGGNPLAAAVGLAALDVLRDEALVERSAHEGAWLKSSLLALRHPLVRDVRGKGLWVGVEIDPRVPAKDVAKGMLELGVLVKDTHGTVLRFAPPLVIERAEIDVGVHAFRTALDALAN